MDQQITSRVRWGRNMDLMREIKNRGMKTGVFISVML